MFNLFHKYVRNKANVVENQTNINNDPSYFFSKCGAALNGCWQNIVQGENKAVSQYEDFCNFNAEIITQQLLDSLNKPMLTLENGTAGGKMVMTEGEIAYLSIFNLNKSIILRRDNDAETFSISLDELGSAVDRLSKEEVEYSDKIARYFYFNFISAANKVTNLLWGYDKSRFRIPLNTAKYLNYHKYIAEEDYDFTGGEFSKWNVITNAPIFEKSSNEDNPIVPIQIDEINAFVLDYLCFCNEALPTSDMFKVLYYQDENGSIKDELEKTFGFGAFDFVRKSITDYNCADFRRWVCLGIKKS